MKIIPTHFDGRFFRSRLEARWAVFFKYLAIEYAYEPEGFVLSNGKPCLPDFFLPDVYYRGERRQVWYVEVKPKGTYNEKLDLLCGELNIPGILLSGQVRPDNHFEHGNYRDGGMGFRKCVDCYEVKIDFGIVYPRCPACGAYTCDKIVFDAIDAANSARFER